MWNWLKELFGQNGRAQSNKKTGVKDHGNALSVVVSCDRCGEHIHVRMRKSSDIQRNYEPGEFAFYVQKTVVGNECFNRIEMRLEFDSRYRLISGDVKHGTIVTD